MNDTFKLYVAHVATFVAFFVVVMPFLLFSLLLVILIYMYEAYKMTLEAIKYVLGLDKDSESDYNESNSVAFFDEEDL